MPTPCDVLRQDLGGLFICKLVESGVRIRTPYLYPDGDVIDLFLRTRTSGERTLSDLGETVRWLRMQTITSKRSTKQSSMIQDIAINHGVEFFKGMLQARVKNDAELADAVSRVSQAALRVSDIWFTFRTRVVQPVSDDVAEYLQEARISFSRTPRLAGRSGRIWTPDFQTRAPSKSCLVYVLCTGNRSAARSITNMVHTSWYDLSNLQVGAEGLRFVSLFDDTVDVWAEEDFRLLEDMSTVARWSAPDEFKSLLLNAG